MKVAIDFETYYDRHYTLTKLSVPEYLADPRFRIIGVAVKINGGAGFWASEQVLAGLPWDEVELISHTPFDMAICGKLGYRPKRYVDTAGLVRAILGTRADLKTAMALLGMQKGDIGKTEQNPHDSALIQYAINDVNGCWAIYEALYPHLPEIEREIMHLVCRFCAEPVLEIGGSITEGYQVLLETRAKALEGYDLATLRSGFRSYLESLGLNPPASLANSNGEYRRFVAAHPEHARLFAARRAAMSTSEIKRAEKFCALKGTKLALWQVYYGAHTGRSAGGGGVNVQNLARGSCTRRCLTAPRGHVVLVADSAQIELRIAAWLAEQQDILETFAAGEDVYCHVATKHFGYPVTKGMPERQFGKQLALGLGYGMGARKFADVANLDLQAAQRAVALWRSQNPRFPWIWERFEQAISEMHRGTETAIRCVSTTKHAIVLPNGMRLHYHGLTYDDGWVYSGKKRIYGGLLFENVVQALARIVVFEQMLEVDKICRVVGTTHDEIIAVCREDEADAIAASVRRIMQTPPRWGNVPLDAEVAYDRVYSK